MKEEKQSRVKQFFNNYFLYLYCCVIGLMAALQNDPKYTMLMGVLLVMLCLIFNIWKVFMAMSLDLLKCTHTLNMIEMHISFWAMRQDLLIRTKSHRDN